MRLLDVVLPVYNEEEALPGFLRALVRVLEGEGLDWRVHLVVDRSSDRTEEVVRKLCAGEARVRALLMSGRFGHQESLLAGLHAARPDAPVVMMDADGQHPPELVPRLLAAHEKGADVVLTRRRATRDQGLASRLASNAFYRVISWLSGLSLDPGMADFRLLGPDVAQVFREAIAEQSPFLRGLIGWMGFEQTVLDYEAPERLGGRTKYDWWRRLQFARNAIIAFSQIPLRLAAPVGVTVAAAAIFYGVYLAGLALVGSDPLPPGWVTLVLVGLVLGGLQLAFVGVLGEYLANVYNETRRRPRFIVRQALNYPEGGYRRFG